MSMMEEREKNFERQFAQDQELQFKAMAKRDRFLGLWAAKQLGKEGHEAEIYAREVILSDMKQEGDQDLLFKIQEDFKASGLDYSDKEIEQMMEQFLEQAKKEILDN